MIVQNRQMKAKNVFIKTRQPRRNFLANIPLIDRVIANCNCWIRYVFLNIDADCFTRTLSQHFDEINTTERQLTNFFPVLFT